MPFDEVSFARFEIGHQLATFSSRGGPSHRFEAIVIEKFFF